MIHFEISNTTPDLNGIHVYQKNSLLIASKSGHLKIPDLGRNLILNFEVSLQNTLSLISTHPFEVNGTLRPQKCLLKPGDVISLNQIQMKIISFEYFVPLALKDRVNSSLDKLMEHNMNLVNIFKMIKK